MNTTLLQEQLQRAADSFADSLVDLFTGILNDVASQVAVDKLSVARAPSAPRPAAKPAAKAAKPVARPAAKPAAKPAGKLVRRSVAQLEETGKRVLDLLRQRPAGLRIEQINKELGTSTRDLMRPIKLMLDDRRMRKTGDRRATVYFAS